MGNDKKVARFNIRTTDPDLDHVKNEILKAFGPSLARVEMTASDGKPIAAAVPPGDSGQGGRPTVGRPQFAGGREYELTFNTTAFNSTEPPARSSRPLSPRFSRMPRSSIQPRDSRSSSDVDRSGIDNASRSVPEAS